jgi:hypothetical protein
LGRNGKFDVYKRGFNLSVFGKNWFTKKKDPFKDRMLECSCREGGAYMKMTSWAYSVIHKPKFSQ